MESFPCKPPNIETLYPESCALPNAVHDGHQSTPKLHCANRSTLLNYSSRLQIIPESKMYEPVPAGTNCVTVISNAKLTNGRGEEVVLSAGDGMLSDMQARRRRDNADTPPDAVSDEAIEVRVVRQHQHPPDEDMAHRLEDGRTLFADMYPKRRTGSVGVQTTPPQPYRLRVLPTARSPPEAAPPAAAQCTRIAALQLCCGRLVQLVLSQVGLVIILTVWALLGAAAFYETEGPREEEQAAELSSMQNELAVGLATELRQILPHDPLWIEKVHKYMEKHEKLLLNAVTSGYGEGGGDGGHIWTYPGCLLFAVSLLTTLGFGAPVPRTTLGRGAAVLFAAIGIPLHFLLILNFGIFAAAKLQQAATTTTTAGGEKGESQPQPQPAWIRWFPVASVVLYYLLGVVAFGLVRRRDVGDSLMFPLDFTATGGVGKTMGYVRIFYALYLEAAVTLAATVVSLLQVSASRTFLDIGLKLGLLTNG